jgi:hypothetical protein
MASRSYAADIHDARPEAAESSHGATARPALA